MSSTWIEPERSECERRLQAAVPAASEAPQRLHQAMRHSLLGGGKRLRPLLCRAAARAIVGSDCELAWTPAVAVELVHTYSLIHDDLPALDNDELRRGQPTCHVVFGEALAILAGDALLTRAFAVLAAAPEAAAMVAVLAAAAGTPGGMVAGQVADMEARRDAPLAAVRAIHERKTAALLRASLVLGARAAGAGAAQQEALGRCGAALGLAFQIADDVLDASASSAELGKTAGKDAAQNKATWVAAVGLEAACRTAADLTAEAEAALGHFGPAADHLRDLARLITARRG
ncbi:MAG: polyprenyl synthetase family protein [Acidobacteria bacterium]|nr:MAG: polyprenyl synthetase family protein [Acidobacteriota bacterium]